MMTAPVLPPQVDPLGPPPSISDPLNFDARADSHVAGVVAMTPQINQSNLVTYNNAVIAYDAATLATSKAAETTAAVNAANSAADAAQVAAVAVDAQSTNATSLTPLSIATGGKSIATQAAKSFFVGMNVKIAYTANTANYMLGVVTSFAGGVLAVDVFDVFGTGTFSDWSITRYVEEARSTAGNIMLYKNFL